VPARSADPDLAALLADLGMVGPDGTLQGVVRLAADIGGGKERVEVDGSTDALGWFGVDELAELPIVPLMWFALGLPVRERETGAAQSASRAEASSA
jgi:hypothetical protein